MAMADGKETGCVAQVRRPETPNGSPGNRAEMILERHAGPCSSREVQAPPFCPIRAASAARLPVIGWAWAAQVCLNQAL